jgi:hypothetical protein
MPTRVIVFVLGFAAAAHALTLDGVRVDTTLFPTSKDRFRVHAHLSGIDPARVVKGPALIRFGDLRATIAVGGFRRHGSAYTWKSFALGVKKVTVNVRKRTIDIVGGGQELGDLSGPVLLGIGLADGAACGRFTWAGAGAGRGKGGVRKTASGPLDPCIPAPDGLDHVPPHVTITSPTTMPGTTTILSTIAIGGVASDDVALAGLTWSNDRGGGASLVADAAWSVADVPLQPGDNRLTVTATDGDGNTSSDTLDVTYNTNGIAFEGMPSADPDALFVDEADTVKIRQAIVANDDLDKTTVALEELNDDATTTDVGPMADDGKLGDVIPGDGIWTRATGVTQSSAGTRRFRLRAHTLSMPDLVAYSPVLTLPIVPRVENTDLDWAVALANQARALTQNLAAEGASQDETLAQAVELARAAGAVAAGASDGGLGIWWVLDTGLLGGALAYDESSRRGGTAADRAPSATHAPTRIVRADPTPVAGEVGTRHSLILAPYFSDAEPLAVDTMLAGLQCPAFPTDTFMGSDADAENFKHLEEYGLVLIASHGDSLFGNVGAAYRPEWGWDATGTQGVVLTGTHLTSITRRKWDRDLRLGRMAVFPDGAGAILPAFFTHYSERMPASIVYVGSCRSMADAGLANTFLGLGASAVLGYDGYVDSTFAGERGVDLFTKLLAGQPLDQAFTPGMNDGGTPPAMFTMDGNAATTLPIGPIANGSFEVVSGFAASVTGFLVKGDGRIVNALGATGPTVGSRMALVSTGLGLTTSSGSFEQSVCVPALPAGKTKLTLYYDWDFFSEEFIEYCGSPFQDSFEVTLGTTSLQSTKVDDLCGSVTHVDGLAFDQGDVWATGWLTQAVDLTAFAGTTQTLKFAARDVGDSQFDTVILIDNVRLVAE